MPFIINQIEQAVTALRAGNPVAIPTETVYGLAAMIDHQEAIKAVFTMKGRPLNHPLIVHIGADWPITDYVTALPDYAKQLIKAFWPGPLTLILPRNQIRINSLVTGGQETVAIRCPAHPIAQKVLQQLQTPLVAPSANPFGKISPTTALHVKQSFPNQDLLILDGGRCSIGIESTIVDATQANTYQILRHGTISEAALAKATHTPLLEKESSMRTPGNLDSHYQPQKPLYYFHHQKQLESFCQQKAGTVFVIASHKPASVNSLFFCPLEEQPEKAAYGLYYNLRQADASSAQCIAIELPPINKEWLGVRERILKAGTAFQEAP